MQKRWQTENTLRDHIAHRGGRRVFKLTEVLKRTLTAPTAYLRSLKDKVRNKIEQKDKTPRYLSGLRKQNRNGK